MNSKSRRAFLCAALFALLIGNVKASVIAYTSLSDGSFGTVDLNTGAFSLLGNSSGYAFPGLGALNGVLYGTFYNTTTGNLFQISPSNGSLTGDGGATVDYECLGATTSGLYALGWSAYGFGSLYSINPANGAAAFIGPTGVSMTDGTMPGVGGAWFSLSVGSSTLYFSYGGNLYKVDTATGAATKVGTRYSAAPC